MNKSRIISALAGTALAAIALTGCSTSAPAPAPAPAEEGTTKVEEGTTKVEETAPAEKDTASVADGITAPGSELALGDWATYEFTGLEDQTAVIQARLVSVEKISAEQDAFLRENVEGLGGYDIYMMKVEQKKVSGAEVIYEGDYTAFKPAREDGSRAQQLTVIGWDDCRTQAFNAEFEAGETITQCVLGLVDSGAKAPAGVTYSQYDSVYDAYEGEPIFFRA